MLLPDKIPAIGYPRLAPQLGVEHSFAVAAVNAEHIAPLEIERRYNARCRSFSGEQWKQLWENGGVPTGLIHDARIVLGMAQEEALKEFLKIEAKPPLHTRASVEHKAIFRFEEIAFPSREDGKPLGLILHVTYHHYILKYDEFFGR